MKREEDLFYSSYTLSKSGTRYKLISKEEYQDMRKKDAKYASESVELITLEALKINTRKALINKSIINPDSLVYTIATSAQKFLEYMNVIEKTSSTIITIPVLAARNIKDSLSYLYEETEIYFRNSTGDKNGENVLKVLEEAENGNPNSQTTLADILSAVFTETYVAIEDIYLPEIPLLARQWYRKAAMNGSIDAQFELATMFYYGLGVEINYSVAYKWFLKCAEKDNIHAQYKIAYMLRMGQGVDQDYKKAYEWLKKITTRVVPLSFHETEDERVFSAAKEMLADLYYRGTEVKASYKIAFELYGEISTGSNYHHFMRGFIRYCGLHGHSNFQEAVYFFKLAHPDPDLNHHSYGKPKNNKKPMWIKRFTELSNIMYRICILSLKLNDLGNLQKKQILEEGKEHYIKTCYHLFLDFLEERQKLNKLKLEEFDLLQIDNVILILLLQCNQAMEDAEWSITLLENIIQYEFSGKNEFFFELAKNYQKRKTCTETDLKNSLECYTTVINNPRTTLQVALSSAQQILIILQNSVDITPLKILKHYPNDKLLNECFSEIAQQGEQNHNACKARQELLDLLGEIESYENFDTFKQRNIAELIKIYNEFDKKIEVCCKRINDIKHPRILSKNFNEQIQAKLASLEYNISILLFQQDNQTNIEQYNAKKWLFSAASRGHAMAQKMLPSISLHQHQQAISEHAFRVTEHTKATIVHTTRLGSLGKSIEEQTIATVGQTEATKEQTKELVKHTQALSKLIDQQKIINASACIFQAQMEDLKALFEKRLEEELSLVSLSFEKNLASLEKKEAVELLSLQNAMEADKKLIISQFKELKKTLEAEVSTRKNNVAHLEREIHAISAELTNHTQKINGSEKQLEHLLQAQALLLKNYSYDKEQFEKQARLKMWQETMKREEPSRYRFYATVRFKLRATFHGYQTLASKLVERNKNTPLDQAGSLVGFIGEFIQVPFVAKIAGGIKSFLNSLANKKATKTADQIASLTNTYAELDELVEEVSTKLAERYQEQLNAVTEDGAIKLALYAIKYIIAFMSEAEIKSSVEHSLSEKLVNALTQESLNKTIKDIFAFKKENIATVNNAHGNWNYEGIFQRAGIKIKTGQIPEYRYFCNIKQRPFKYLYRLGNPEELVNAIETTTKIKTREENDAIHKQLKQLPSKPNPFPIQIEKQTAPKSALEQIQICSKPGQIQNIFACSPFSQMILDNPTRLIGVPELQELRVEYAKIQETQMILDNMIVNFNARLNLIEAALNSKSASARITASNDDNNLQSRPTLILCSGRLSGVNTDAQVLSPNSVQPMRHS